MTAGSKAFANECIITHKVIQAIFIYIIEIFFLIITNFAIFIENKWPFSYKILYHLLLQKFKSCAKFLSTAINFPLKDFHEKMKFTKSTNVSK